MVITAAMLMRCMSCLLRFLFIEYIIYLNHIIVISSVNAFPAIVTYLVWVNVTQFALSAIVAYLAFI
jgi:hypothetical protein